jgi:nitroreductase
MEVLEAINTRRSVGRVSDKPLSRQTVEKLLAAAVAAPNHHESEPWRFFVLSGQAREGFGEALAESLRNRRPDMDAERLEALCTAERMKPLRAPVLIVVACKRSVNPRIVHQEDLHACSAAIQNLLLTAHGQGLAAMWRTGEGVYAPDIKAHFGLSPDDDIAGVVYLGYPVESDGGVSSARERAFEPFTVWRVDDSN